MRVIEPKPQHGGVKKRQARRRFLALLGTLLILFFVVYGVIVYNRPLPPVSANSSTFTVPAQAIRMQWPAYGQAAVGALNYGLLATNQTSSSPLPMASTAKVMTAWAVLHQYPLSSGQQGPLITLTDNDVALYQSYMSQGGSVVAVAAGEQISEYQALQALLLPSANNIADSLAIWAFGSMANYLSQATSLTKTMGLAHTTLTDASGFSASSVSTASDLVILGETALSNPVLAEIVGQREATIPIAGVIQNVNVLLGQAGIIGIKTGNTEEAGGCYLFAAVQSFDSGQQVTVVGAIMGAPSLGAAFSAALPLLSSVHSNFATRTLISAHQTVAYYIQPWGGGVPVVTTKDLVVFGWKGSSYKLHTGLLSLKAPKPKGVISGTLGVQTETGRVSVALAIDHPITIPSKLWRLSH